LATSVEKASFFFTVAIDPSGEAGPQRSWIIDLVIDDIRSISALAKDIKWRKAHIKWRKAHFGKGKGLVLLDSCSNSRGKLL
jgi:hypothetical protein